jgi:hypothetical protein
MRANALLLANEHIEVIRALPFDSVGTVAGLPSGNIPQLETIIHDGKEYTRRTFIQYVDDPADGLGAADTLAADYKRVKVELSYHYRGATSSFAAVTTVAPRSQESLVGAGVLRINVTDALNVPIQGTTVHVVNNTVATSVDITTATNASGTVSFPGAWAGTGYEIYISKAGYSGAQTYSTSTENPNPSPMPYNVAENGTTEVYFKIDLLSSIGLLSRGRPVAQTVTDLLDDAGNLNALNNTQVAAGALTLAGAPGSYVAAGDAETLAVTPASFDEWLMVQFEEVVPANTSLAVTVEYDSGGSVFVPVPDVDLPGNAAGFTSSPIDIGVLSTTTYTSLRLVADLTSTDVNVTPELLSYDIAYHEANVPVPNLSFTITGSKQIGVGTSGPLFKYDEATTTNAAGQWSSGPMEWDVYTLNQSGYDTAEACPNLPLVLDPDTNFDQVLTLVAPSTHNLKLRVRNPSSNPVPRAYVRVVGGSTDSTQYTGPCGTVFFPSLSVDTYSVEVRAAGLSATTTSYAVSSSTVKTLQLSL